MSWIAYVGPFPFPWGQAGSRRMCGIAHSLAEAGMRVVVGGGDATPVDYENLNEGEPAGSIRYIGLGESPEKTASVVRKSIRIFLAWGSRTVAWLDSHAVKPSHVIVYGGSAQYMLRLLPWCRKNNVKLIADVVEWYDQRQMTGGALGPFNLSAKFALNYLYPKCDGVIAISSLLEQHYADEGCQVIRIPPTLDVRGYRADSRSATSDTSVLNLIYAGTPGNKDLLGHVIAGVARADPDGQRIRLQVMGPNRDQVLSMLHGSAIPSSVNVLGRVPQVDVAKFITEADFSVLLREPLRFAHAGFPTKFVESLTNGTPVIANLTTDLGLYLRDGIEGVVCADHSVDALVGALNKALALTAEQREDMRAASRKMAESAFDFRVYANDLARFVNSV